MNWFFMYISGYLYFMTAAAIGGYLEIKKEKRYWAGDDSYNKQVNSKKHSVISELKELACLLLVYPMYLPIFLIFDFIPNILTNSIEYVNVQVSKIKKSTLMTWILIKLGM